MPAEIPETGILSILRKDFMRDEGLEARAELLGQWIFSSTEEGGLYSLRQIVEFFRSLAKEEKEDFLEALVLSTKRACQTCKEQKSKMRVEYMHSLIKELCAHVDLWRQLHPVEVVGLYTVFNEVYEFAAAAPEEFAHLGLDRLTLQTGHRFGMIQGDFLERGLGNPRSAREAFALLLEKHGVSAVSQHFGTLVRGVLSTRDRRKGAKVLRQELATLNRHYTRDTVVAELRKVLEGLAPEEKVILMAEALELYGLNLE